MLNGPDITFFIIIIKLSAGSRAAHTSRFRRNGGRGGQENLQVQEEGTRLLWIARNGDVVPRAWVPHIAPAAVPAFR